MYGGDEAFTAGRARTCTQGRAATNFLLARDSREQASPPASKQTCRRPSQVSTTRKAYRRAECAAGMGYLSLRPPHELSQPFRSRCTEQQTRYHIHRARDRRTVGEATAVGGGSGFADG